MKNLTIFLLILALDFHAGHSASISHEHQDQQIAQPYIWPSFPFFPGVNFPPTMPPWMNERRPEIRPILPQLPEIRFPQINLPWPTPAPDDDDSDSDSDESDEDVEKCPDKGTKLISHPENCKKYILCMNGNKITELKCPNGLHFSRDLRACTNPDDADCE